MVEKHRVLFDLNVILDTLQRREPFYATSARLLAYAEIQRIEGLVAAHSLTTLFYLLAKERSPEEARLAVSQLLGFLRVAAVDHETIERALTLPFRDFEDAVQMAAAIQAGVDYLATRDIQDFQPAPFAVIRPAELLTLL